MKGAWIPIYFDDRQETRLFFDEHFDPDPDIGSQYLWSEGNYACDCNRALHWSRSGGEPDLMFDCGFENPRFHIKAAYCVSGEVIEIDGERH